MGSRGPKPTPVPLRILKGDAKKNPARVRLDVPQPKDEDPNMPADLSEAGRAVWRHVMEQQAAGVILAVDQSVLRIHCEAVERYVQAQAVLARTGPLVHGRDGGLVRNPAHQVMRENAELVLKTANHLGLSPASRVSLAMPSEPAGARAADPMARFLGGRTGS